MTAPIDLAQAAYVELALLALERRDLPAFNSAVASIDPATLDRIAQTTTHPVMAALADQINATPPRTWRKAA